MEKDRAPEGGPEARTDDLREWTLSRIDIRSPVAANAWPVARLELIHPLRGRVTDVASAPGAFDAAFIAAGRVLGISPKLISYNVSSLGADAEGSLNIRVDVEIESNGHGHLGTSFGVDLVRCSLIAWLEAACAALDTERVASPPVS